MAERAEIVQRYLTRPLARTVQRTLRRLGLSVGRLSKDPSETLAGLARVRFATVLDVGANEGQFARKARGVFPEARIICFEPLPGACERLTAWAETDGGVEVLNVGASDEDGVMTIHQHDEHDASSSFLQTRPDSSYTFMKQQTSIEVPVRRLDSALASHSLVGPVLLKLDVQGFEPRVLAGAANTLDATDAVVVEVTLDGMYEGQPTFEDILALLAPHGFRFAGNMSQSCSESGAILWFDAVFVRDSVSLVDA